jgi:hypothetical protein
MNKINKGYTLTVTSWENDVDHYNTKSKTVATIEEAKLQKNITFVSIGITEEVNEPLLRNVSLVYFDFERVKSKNGLDDFFESVNKMTLRECEKNIFKYMD